MNVNDFDFPGILTKVLAALVILIITAVLAKVIKSVLSKHAGKLLHRHDAGGQDLGESLGTIASLIIWLFGLIAILNVFALTQVVAPIQDLLNGVLAVLPGIIGAALIFFIGFVLARIVRQLVESLLRSAGADRWMERVSNGSSTGTRAAGAGGSGADGGLTTQATSAGGSTTSSAPALSQIAGQLVFALILIVVSIAALQVLGIEAISDPATQMLNMILTAIPAIIAAALLLGIGYLLSRLIAPLAESTLRGLGTDRALSDLGVSGSTSPSGVIAKIIQVAIILFFAIAATRVLGFPEITAMLDTILEVAGGIVLGGAIIAIGVFIANLAPRFVSGQAGQVIRYAAIALFVAIGLRAMGLADSIVNLAFGAIVVGAAAAAAIAFGLGGRDAAARELERMQANRSANGGSTGGSTGGSIGGSGSSATGGQAPSGGFGTGGQDPLAP